MRLRRILHALALLIAPLVALPAQGSAFCRGFEEGFKTIKGDLALVPVCPVEPVTPVGSTPFREGIKVGTAKGRAAGGRSTGGGSSPDRTGPSLCDGFTEGYKSVKGKMAPVPVCPVAPVTPIGSTPFREGIKAGTHKAGG